MRAALTILLILVQGCLLAQEGSGIREFEELEIDTSAVMFDIPEFEDTTTDAEPTVEPTALLATMNYKADTFKVKPFDSAQWRKIVGTTDFNEEPKEEKKEAEAEYSLRPGPWGGMALKVISYMIILAAGVLVVYYVLRHARITRKTIRNVDKPSDPDLPIEHIDEFDMKSQVDEALRAGNLALVVRYYYLGLLKKLNSAGKINWKKDKTNLEYLGELFSIGYLYTEVRTLTVAYETVWYGERQLSRVHFDQLINDFEEIHRRVGENNTQ